LQDNEIKTVVDFFHGKFPVKVVYPPERIIASRLPHNRLPDKPNSIAFDMKAIVKTPKGTEVWRYADSTLVDSKGRKKYVPKKFMFNGARFLTRNDIELIYFLLRKSEYCLVGDNRGPMVKFTFEDLVSEAEKKAEKRELESRMNLLIYNKDLGLSEDKLRAVAKAYFINDVDSLTLAQVKIVLDSKIRETRDGIQKFFTMVDAEEELKTRMSIQKAIDMGFIKYDDSKSNWYWIGSAERGNVQICKVPPSKTPNEAIYEYYLGDDSFKEDLNALFITKKSKAGRPVKVEVTEGSDGNG